MSEPSKSRTSFSDLPIELRLVIWNLAISPRAVVVQYNYTKKSCISKDIPSLLLVSREARAEALQKYEISFGTRSEVNSTIYFNYELDTVVFDWESFRDSYPSRHMSYHEECCRIKRIRVSDKTLDYLVKNGMRDLTTFKEVEEISISGCYGGAVKSREEYFLSRLSDWFMDDAGMNCYSTQNGHFLPKFSCLDGGRDCPRHFWFRQWNNWAGPRGIRKIDWTGMFIEAYINLGLSD
ncbi:hypothetical protein BCIN_09g03350 [Botrytis cinerea B05.10]|uniref:2EXR domain-containing protein n=1 Tax=Botryotinia fuckeliana (strain B05.10) TaxID=332648 RepID=A0A384JSN0_BOTFB|nr:hypothetical protein BCIN_09g03350 [Botrytis cinerea B05.10]ATZ53491.1 hypothetical protein BCIN_09g03350 [Botrytis cinerea B05.10]